MGCVVPACRVCTEAQARSGLRYMGHAGSSARWATLSCQPGPRHVVVVISLQKNHNADHRSNPWRLLQLESWPSHWRQRKAEEGGVTGEQEDAGATWRGGEGEEDKVVEWRSDGGDME
jgi:hypothetical protein